MIMPRQIDTVKIGIFHFHFGDMTILQNAFLITKMNVMEEQVVDDMWPIGEFIYFLYKLEIPFKLTYEKPEGVSEAESEKLYVREFLPLYMKCLKAGVINLSELKVS